MRCWRHCNVRLRPGFRRGLIGKFSNSEIAFDLGSLILSLVCKLDLRMWFLLAGGSFCVPLLDWLLSRASYVIFFGIYVCSGAL